MSIFSKLLADLNGAQSFPQPPRSVALLTFALILLSPHSLHAQTGGRIAGAVTDASGAVIPNSQVVLLDPSIGVKQNTTTGGDGVFTFPVVPIGEYELDVAAAGFNAYRQTSGLKIDVNTAQIGELV